MFNSNFFRNETDYGAVLVFFVSAKFSRGAMMHKTAGDRTAVASRLSFDVQC